MATQAQLLAAIESALTSAGYTVAPSHDPASWPSWAVGNATLKPWVAAILDTAETDAGAAGASGGYTDMIRARVLLLALVGNPFDSSAGMQASATVARALRVVAEAVGDTVAARVEFEQDDRTSVGGGVWLVSVRLMVYQTDSF